ncbi:MAG TPA: hypothetical protein VNO33_13385 [Kofleriaceae bacterium]|nr:hypothetical protein [Kofleriaceae bacterium]
MPLAFVGLAALPAVALMGASGSLPTASLPVVGLRAPAFALVTAADDFAAVFPLLFAAGFWVVFWIVLPIAFGGAAFALCL